MGGKSKIPFNPPVITIFLAQVRSEESSSILNLIVRCNIIYTSNPLDQMGKIPILHNIGDETWAEGDGIPGQHFHFLPPLYLIFFVIIYRKKCWNTRSRGGGMHGD